MAGEQLLLRKGTLDRLSTLGCKAGAISITTDVPGIYFDVSDTKRIRLGDFISVTTLNDLNDLAKVGLSEYSLYYVTDDNILAKYDATTQKLQWINNTTDLQKAIKNTNDYITAAFGYSYKEGDTIKGSFDAINAKIGDSDDVDDTTVYGAIAAEKKRASDAEKSLADKIKAIMGDDNNGGSIKDLQDKDVALEALIEKVYGDIIKENSTLDYTVTGVGGDLAELKQTLGNNYANAQENKLEEVVVKIDGEQTDYASAITNKTITVTLPKGLSNYADGNELTDITDDIVANTNLIKQVYGVDSNGTIPAVPATVAQNATDINTIKGLGWDGETIKGVATSISNLQGESQGTAYDDATVRLNAKNIATLKGKNTTYNDATVTDNAKNIADLTARVNTIQGTGENAYTSIAAGVVKAIADANDYTDDQIDALEDAINTTIASANAMTFKGSVSALFNGSNQRVQWWTGSVQAGDTYVIGNNITIDIDGNGSTTNDEPLRVGDLLVASHDQSGDSYPQTIKEAGHTYTDAAPGWYLIRTGYDKNLEPDLVVGSNTVTLQSYAGTSLGAVSFSAPKIVYTNDSTKNGSNIQINTSGTDIQFNLVWVDF